jgi:hypothetical protein
MIGNIYDSTTNEPKVHPLIKNSFAFVPSAGMRLSPEVLILEIFREVFFEKHYGKPSKNKILDPDEMDEKYKYTKYERAVLYALRGRRKKSKNAKEQRFFAPAYPSLARKSWLGKKRERVINNFLFSGPIAQHLWHRGPDVEEKKKEQDKIIGKLYEALAGHSAIQNIDTKGKDILYVTIRQTSFNIDEKLVRKKLKELTEYSDSIIRVEQEDELAELIFRDVESICKLEMQLPRMQWMHLLMSFLRFVLPIWLLAQMRITSILHECLLNAVDNQNPEIKDISLLKDKIANRNRNLLSPTLTPTREVYDHIEQYMKNRVELSILLNCLERIKPNYIANKKLAMDERGADFLSLEILIDIAKTSSDALRKTERFKEVARGSFEVKKFLTREGEMFSAWRDPLHKGQGKNIDEFLRVMYRDELGDEAGGYLLIPEGRAENRGFRVFPGQLLLKTITYLAAQKKQSYNDDIVGGGKLVLEDVEKHFRQYGIDFSIAADARPLLMKELQAMGLLSGSPDAGGSVAVSCPY